MKAHNGQCINLVKFMQLSDSLNVVILTLLDRVCTGPGKPRKSWNLKIWIPGLETPKVMEFLSRSWKVMKFDVGKYICSRPAYCSGLSEISAGSIPDSYDIYRYLNLVRYSIFDTRYFRRKCNFVYIFRGYLKRLRHKKVH